jgi:hypothetical protein
MVTAMTLLPGDHARGEIVRKRRQYGNGLSNAARAARAGGHACDGKAADGTCALAAILPERKKRPQAPSP